MRIAPQAVVLGAAVPVELSGSAFDRGRAQALRCPGTAQIVRDAIARRLAPLREPGGWRAARGFLARQWEFAAVHDPDGVAEVEGIAAGYGVSASDVFASLHVGLLSHRKNPAPREGCSTWALRHPESGALLGKNRDLPGALRDAQRVFRHRDPAWNGRTVLCVGSLGSPGVYSSGINSDGLALADTEIRTTDQGIGLLRYSAMTRVLARCATVAEAVEDLRGLRHAGSGSLVLADAAGGIAAVELGHHAVAIDRGEAALAAGQALNRVARTNHYVSTELRDYNDGDGGDERAGSERRLRLLHDWLNGIGAAPGIADAAAIMASHDGAGLTGLCRHGGDRRSTTISGSVFACRGRMLYFTAQNPCRGAWAAYGCAEPDGGA